ncbi:MAG: phosphoglucosamine mutase [Thermodesulfobacteriota bacterium]|nr:phosphoglucosamine mutase [Thermodesulfobacteriota bacterium]
MKKLFGTDGVRGVANEEPMNVETALKLGKCIAYICKKQITSRPKILIGKDTRLSGYMLENAITAGISSMGVDIMLVGPLPTPGIAFMAKSMRASAGIVISASHNPYYDNGIKIFNGNGFKLPDEHEGFIEKLFFSNKFGKTLKTTTNEIGKAIRIDDAIGRYIMFLKNTFPQQYTLDGYKIVLDCAHGAAYKVAPAVFEELGADLISIGVKPDGENINLNCGALHPEIVRKAVIEHGADLGIALDGDADRVIFLDETGKQIDGDHIMAICAGDMLARRKLRKKTLVTTIMSNMGLDICLKEKGGKVIKTNVGDRYVVEEMIKGGYNLGGEKSGHLIFLDYNTSGDGILSALRVLAIMRRKDTKLSELAKVMVPYPQFSLNIPIKEKNRNILTHPKVQSYIKNMEKTIEKKGRLVIRMSGTEPMLRIMVEGEDKKEIETLANELEEFIKNNI